MGASGWEGLRVVRGPSWKWAMQDGGEGFVGTIVRKKDDKLSLLKKLGEEKLSQAVLVVWDCGTAGYYRAGHEGAYDLRVVDNAAIGVRHNVSCGECCREDIKGFRWFCVKCETNLCSSCYFNDAHEAKNDETHDGKLEYKRYETPGDEPVSVWKILTSTKKATEKPHQELTNSVELKGIFNEALVKKGRDWENGDEDSLGSVSGVGKVVPSSTLGPGWVQVKWPNNNIFSYRVGANGKVDLRLEKHSSGGRYQPDHLPILNFDHHDFVTQVDSEIRFAVGDPVKVTDDVESFKSLQDGHGGWIQEMKHVAGKPGIVRGVNTVGIEVEFDNGKKWQINPDSLLRLAPFSIGQPVRVKEDQDTRRKAATKKIIGETGTIQRCLNDSEVEVVLDGYERPNATRKLQANWLEKFRVNEAIRTKVNKLKRKLVQIFVDAASNGEIPVLKDLQSTRFLNVNDKGEKGLTALHLASRYGQLETVEWLLGEGADVDQKDDKDRSAIHHAAKGCQPAVLSLLLRGNTKLMDAKDKKGLTPLQLTTKAGCIKCIRVLMNNGCNVMIQDNDGDTALYNAIILDAGRSTYRDYGIVATLLERKDFATLSESQDLDHTNNCGLNAILLAAAHGNRRVLKDLLKNHGDYLGDSVHRQERKNGFTALHFLCHEGDYLGLKVFMKYAHDAYINALIERRCKHGPTPLLLAAHKCHYSIIEYLISGKENRRNIRSDITATDDDGDTAVHLVAASLDKLTEVPNERDSPEIYKIYQELWSEYPGLAECYPALSLMCYLIKHGCPWRRTSYRKALQVINNDMFREVLKKYCPQGDADDYFHSLTCCALCEATNVEPSTVLNCNHTIDSICNLCLLSFKRCPTCLSPNKAYARNQEDSSKIFSGTERGKITSDKSTKALNAQIADGGHQERDQHARSSQGAAAELQSTTSKLNPYAGYHSDTSSYANQSVQNNMLSKNSNVDDAAHTSSTYNPEIPPQLPNECDFNQTRMHAVDKKEKAIFDNALSEASLCSESPKIGNQNSDPFRPSSVSASSIKVQQKEATSVVGQSNSDSNRE